MSDGNYNRNLLPYNNYQSGVRAGEARMRTLALKTFEDFLHTQNISDSDEERQQLMADFKKKLQ